MSLLTTLVSTIPNRTSVPIVRDLVVYFTCSIAIARPSESVYRVIGLRPLSLNLLREELGFGRHKAYLPAVNV